MGLERSRVIRFSDVSLEEVVAHEGRGRVHTRRVLCAEDGSGLDFVDMTVVPPGASVGRHTHAADEEEHYLILSGRGVVQLDGVPHAVGPGDLLVNRPGGTHSLDNPGPEPLRMVVWQVPVR